MHLPIPGGGCKNPPECVEATEVLHKLTCHFNTQFLDYSDLSDNVDSAIWSKSHQRMDKALLDLCRGTISLNTCLIKIQWWALQVGKEIDRGIRLACDK